jgi:hypothetical protein
LPDASCKARGSRRERQRALAGEIDSFQQAKRYVLPSGESALELLQRVRESLTEHDLPVPSDSSSTAPEGITRVLELVRTQLGTLCDVDGRPHPEFTERHAELLRFLGDLTAELIENEAGNPEIQLARAADNGCARCSPRSEVAADAPASNRRRAHHRRHTRPLSSRRGDPR